MCALAHSPQFRAFVPAPILFFFVSLISKLRTARQPICYVYWIHSFCVQITVLHPAVGFSSSLIADRTFRVPCKDSAPLAKSKRTRLAPHAFGLLYTTSILTKLLYTSPEARSVSSFDGPCVAGCSHAARGSWNSRNAAARRGHTASGTTPCTSR